MDNPTPNHWEELKSEWRKWAKDFDDRDYDTSHYTDITKNIEDWWIARIESLALKGERNRLMVQMRADVLREIEKEMPPKEVFEKSKGFVGLTTLQAGRNAYRTEMLEIIRKKKNNEPQQEQ